jgi:hypothetical protein
MAVLDMNLAQVVLKKGLEDCFFMGIENGIDAVLKEIKPHHHPL